MSIEQITCNATTIIEDPYRRKVVAPYFTAPVQKSNDGLVPRGPDLRNWGSVASDETE